MSLFDQPKRRVHTNPDDEDIASCLRPISEDEPFELTEEQTEEVITALYNFKQLAKAGYLELSPENMKILDQL